MTFNIIIMKIKILYIIHNNLLLSVRKQFII